MPVDPWSVASVEDAPASAGTPKGSSAAKGSASTGSPETSAGDPWAVAGVENVRDPNFPKIPMPVPPGLRPGFQPATSPGYMGIPGPTVSPYDPDKVIDAAKTNIGNYARTLARANATNPEAGGSPVELQNGKLVPTPPTTAADLSALAKASDQPMLPLAAGEPAGTLEHGILTGMQSLTTPTNAATIAAAWPLGTMASLAKVGYSAVAVKTAQLALDGYFTYQMAHGASQSVQEAYDAFKKGDLGTMADKLGAGSVEAVFGALGIYHGLRGTGALLKTPVPKLPPTPDQLEYWSVGHSGWTQKPASGEPEAAGPYNREAAVVPVEPKNDPWSVQKVEEATTPGSSPVEPPAEKPTEPVGNPPPSATSATGNKTNEIAGPGIDKEYITPAESGEKSPLSPLVPAPETPKSGDKSDKSADEWAVAKVEPETPQSVHPIETAKVNTEVNPPSEHGVNKPASAPDVFDAVAPEKPASATSCRVREASEAGGPGPTSPETGESSIGAASEAQQPGTGGNDVEHPLAPLYREYAGKPHEAIARLLTEKTGAAPNIWSNPNVPRGKIGLAWGVPGDPNNDWKGGYGLSHIIAKHVEARQDFDLADLPDLVPNLKLVDVTNRNRLIMETPDHRAIVSLDWFGRPEHWIISTYEPRKEEGNRPSPPEGPYGVPGAPEGGSLTTPAPRDGSISSVEPQETPAQSAEGEASTTTPAGVTSAAARPDGVQIFSVPESGMHFIVAAHPDFHEGPVGSNGVIWAGRELKRRGLAPENVLGSVSLMPHGTPAIYKPGYVEVDPSWQRKGIASAMYALGEQAIGQKIAPSEFQTEEGEAFSRARNGATIEGAEQRGERSESGPTAGSRETGVSRTGTPAERPGAPGEETSVIVPGEDTEIRARYEVRDLTELRASHNGHTFLANPEYAHHNERDYSKPENQQRIINQSSEEKFEPRYLVTDNPDALNGPPVIDEAGNVLGGNSRAMTVERVYTRNGKAAANYRALLEKKAQQFGIDPATFAHMESPVLVRVASDEDLAALPGGSKWAIRKTNVSGTAALSASEQATADAGQLTPEMKGDIAQAIEAAGAGATLNEALTGKSGTALVNQLIAQGFFSEQERPKLMDGKTGALTQLAKDRIAKALLGEFFHDSDQYQRFPASLKQKLERVAAPLATVAGDRDWDLLPAVREAVDLIEYADAHGIQNLDDVTAQRDMFGGETSEWTPEAVALAKTLRDEKPNAVVAAFRKYVHSKEPTMFGESTPAEAFQEAFEPHAKERAAGRTLANLRDDDEEADEPTPAESKPAKPKKSGDSGVYLGSGLGAMQPYFAKFLKGDVVPTARQVGELLKLVGKDLQAAFAPASIQGAENAALSVRANAAELARSRDRAEAALHVAKKYFDAQPAQDNYDFIDRVEHGQPQPTPELQHLADTMRDMLDRRRDAIRALGTGKLENFIEDYFPHVWQLQWGQRPGAQANANNGKRPLAGTKSFLKKRTIETFSDGIAAGLKPISDNPVDMVLAKAREMDKYLFAHHILADLANQGQLKFLRATKPVPAGWQKIDDPVATVWGTPSHAGARQIEGFYIAPEPAARILNNYLSPGLRDKSAIVRAFMSGSNLLNQAQLGFSGFHAVFTGLEAATSKLALGIYQAAHGDVGKALKSIATTPVAPITTFLRGREMRKEWLTPGSQGALIGELVDAAVKAGGRAKMEDFYRTHFAKRMMEAWRQGNVLGAMWRAPLAVFEGPTRLIMEGLVPNLKMGAFADMAQYELERLGTNASDPDVQAALARAWDSIDNRFGQLVYDNLFWSKVTKDLGMLGVRSLGWNVGDIRELAGGYADAARLATGNGRKQGGVTHRMAYIPAHLLIAAALGALLYYLWHGEAPHHLKDYFFPKDAHGKRWSPATYVRDEYAWAHDPVATAEGKANPLLTLAIHVLENRDFRGRHIMNPHHHWPKELKELAEYVMKEFEPLWVEQMARGHHGLDEKILPEIGITRAPKSLDQPTR